MSVKNLEARVTVLEQCVEALLQRAGLLPGVVPVEPVDVQRRRTLAARALTPDSVTARIVHGPEGIQASVAGDAR